MRKQAIFATFFGGDKRDRTADLLNAIQALSQLSYTPGLYILHNFRSPFYSICTSFWGHTKYFVLSQLSYTPIWTARGILANKIPLVNHFFLFFPSVGFGLRDR